MFKSYKFLNSWINRLYQYLRYGIKDYKAIWFKEMQ